MMKADKERLKRLLTDTVKVFINDSMRCHNAMSVEGLIGITLDNEVLLVYVNESDKSCTGMVGGVAANSDSCSREMCEGLDTSPDECVTSW